jgi:hypothetical protein
VPLLVLALANALDLEGQRREHGDAVCRWHQPLLGLDDDAIHSRVLIVQVPADDVDLEGALTLGSVREQAFSQPDEIRVRCGQDLFEVSPPGLPEQLGPARMTGTNQHVDERGALRRTAVLGV